MKDFILIIFLFSLFACGNESQYKKANIFLPVLIDSSEFNSLVGGKKVQLFTLKNKSGIISQITNYGGRVVSMWTPDRDGSFEDIVLGYDNFQAYQGSEESYFGALIGRYSNRIGNGNFQLNGKQYHLHRNNGTNHLHGGGKGFDAKVWDANQINDQQLELTYLSPNGEEGYPGNLSIKVLYSLTDENELKVEYWATTDATTIVNLTHHSYFNLLGAGNGSILNHTLRINADYYTPVDSTLIPNGEIASVKGTPMDFRSPVFIGKRIDDDFEQLKFGKGYDHNWVLNKGNNQLSLAAEVSEPNTGRTMEVYTNEPGMQFYTGNFLSRNNKGKNTKPYFRRSAFCLETQHFPDSPNHDNFPTTVLNPGEEYYSICIYKFGVE